jgi:glycosyltransferase involved in cell wall biosynthesis
MTMRIGIGAQLGIVGGPATYAAELARALVRLGGHEYVVFTDRPEAFAGAGIETVHVPLPSTFHQVAWDHVRLPGLLGRHGVALYHGTKGIRPIGCPVPSVVTVHDLAVYAHPETFAWPQRWHFRLCVPPSVARAARVIADSGHARADLVSRFRVAPEHVRVVPLGVADRFRVPPDAAVVARVRARLGLGDAPIVACVGTVQPRKRVERVLEAFSRARGPERGWQLVVAGRLRPGYVPAWTTVPPPGVRWLGPLDDESLRVLYGLAAVVVSASEYEGFGLTLCEGMAAGAAVVAVDTSSIPEVVGDAGLLVARSDAELLAGALGRLLDDRALRDELGRRAAVRAAGFTWEATARGTRAVYDEVLGS